MMALAQREGSPGEIRIKFSELRGSNQEKLLATLTADQKVKLREMTGQPFTSELGIGF
jgi:hypothetical protein